MVKDGLCSSSDEAYETSLKLYAQRFDVQVELAGIDDASQGHRLVVPRVEAAALRNLIAALRLRFGTC